MISYSSASVACSLRRIIVVNTYALRIQDLVAAGPLGRSAIYEAIKSGALPARKYGRSTIILTSDWHAFLSGLPERKAASNSPTEVRDPYDL
jgi:hypothetical protein